VIRLRRHLSRLLARWAVRLNPDPALSFTTTKVRDLREESSTSTRQLDLLTLERGVAGRGFTPGRGHRIAY
jgi:hypothetical protein